MDWMFGDESHSDSCKTGRDIIQKSASYLAEKDTGEKNQKVGSIVSMLMREAVIVGFTWFLIVGVVPSVPPVGQNY